ncbi:MAG: ComEA family DNA-binding protein [Vicinamibacterales bacterium]
MFKAILVLAIASVLVGTGPATARQAAQAPQAKGATQGAGALDLNTATLAQLETLPGVGPKLAERILQHRQKIGRFSKVEELMNVQGIGEKNFLRLKPLVTVTPVQKNELTGKAGTGHAEPASSGRPERG